MSTQYSSERLPEPLIRKSGELTKASWGEALDLVATQLSRAKHEWGAASIVHYRSGGSLGLLKHLTDYFFSLFGPVTVKRGDICSGVGQVAQRLDFGESDSNDLFTLLDSKNIILWGKNLATSSPHTLRVVHDARKAGARVLLIDPIFHATAKHVDDYVQPRPGGDFALAMAAARLCFEYGFTDPAAPEYCDGFDAFQALCHRASVEDWCDQADVLPEQALLLARMLGNRPTAILVGWGLGRRTLGGTIVRAIDALGTITGNVGVRGGGVSYYYRRRAAFDLSFTEPNPPPRTVRETLLASDIAQLRDPPARVLWVTAANPVVMLPDSDATAHMLQSMPFSVVVDSFLTDTARLATVVLPTTTLLEADDLLGSNGHHYLGVATPVVSPPSGVKSDLEIVQALAERLGLGTELAGSAKDWKQRLIAARLGAHRIDLTRLEQGHVKNPLAPEIVFAGRKFPTPSGKANLLREQAVADVVAPSEAYPLMLMALSTPKSQSSQWAHAPELPLPLVVNPASAAGAGDGEVCDIESTLGRMPVRIVYDANQRRDVALLPKGGHRSSHACANQLIRARLTDLGEGAAFYEECVRIVLRTEHE